MGECQRERRFWMRCCVWGDFSRQAFPMRGTLEMTSSDADMVGRGVVWGSMDRNSEGVGILIAWQECFHLRNVSLRPALCADALALHAALLERTIT